MLGQNQRRVGRHLRVVKTSKLSQTDRMRLLSAPNFSYFATIAHPCIHIQIEPKRKKFGISDGRKQLKYLLSEVIKIFGAIRKNISGFTLTRRPFVRCTTCAWPRPRAPSRSSPSSAPTAPSSTRRSLCATPGLTWTARRWSTNSL